MTHTIKYSETQTQVCFFNFLFSLLYIKESIMETKHKRQVQVKNKISLIKLTIHNNTATIIVQYPEEYHTVLSRKVAFKTIMGQ